MTSVLERLERMSQHPAGRHHYLLVCRNCNLIVQEYSALCRVPFMVKCPECGLSRKSHFVKRFHKTNLKGLSVVFVTSINSRLGEMVMRLVRMKRIRIYEDPD